jgi:hypothetical protein
MYVPTSEYEDVKVEELYGVLKAITEYNKTGATNTIIMTGLNSVVGDESE